MVAKSALLLVSWFFCLFLPTMIYAADPEPQLVKDIFTGDFNSSSPYSFIEFNGKLYFGAEDSDHGNELWVSDGTSEGTSMVKDIYPGTENSFPTDIIEVNGNLFFTASNEANGRELWVSDGTTDGTNMVKDIRSGSSNSIPDDSDSSDFVEFQNKLYFVATDGTNGYELWVSDGTTDGTNMVNNLRSGIASSNPNYLTVVGDNLYFRATGDTQGTELYIMNSSEVITMVEDIYPEESSSNPTSLTALGTNVYFAANDGSNGRELWISDGTAGGTNMVKNISELDSSNPMSMTVYNGKLYFRATDSDNEYENGYELWVSDGTPAGTNMVKNINPSSQGSSYPTNYYIYDGKLYFTTDDGTNGNELWVTDGTIGGTNMVKDMNPLGHSNPTYLVVFDDTLYFSADDGTNGNELWVSDGTTGGTSMVKDINTDYINSDGSFSPAHMTALGTSLYFSATDDGLQGTELWSLASSTEGDPTPTPSSTVADPSTPSSQSNTPVTSSSNSAPVCGDAHPSSSPDLFQMNVTGNSAKLFFTPITNTNKYFISFSTKPGAEEHGAEASLSREGVQSYTVNLLNPNTNYYFKVRGQNGCMPGNWSNIMKITTQQQTSGTVSFYKNSTVQHEPTYENTQTITTGTVEGASTVEPETEAVILSAPIIPLPTKAIVQTSSSPKKFCILWWCF